MEINLQSYGNYFIKVYFNIKFFFSVSLFYSHQTMKCVKYSLHSLQYLYTFKNNIA